MASPTSATELFTALVNTIFLPTIIPKILVTLIQRCMKKMETLAILKKMNRSGLRIDH